MAPDIFAVCCPQVSIWPHQQHGKPGKHLPETTSPNSESIPQFINQPQNCPTSDGHINQTTRPDSWHTEHNQPMESVKKRAAKKEGGRLHQPPPLGLRFNSFCPKVPNALREPLWRRSAPPHLSHIDHLDLRIHSQLGCLGVCKSSTAVPLAAQTNRSASAHLLKNMLSMWDRFVDMNYSAHGTVLKGGVRGRGCFLPTMYCRNVHL